MLISILPGLLFVGCLAANPTAENLYGKWRSKNVQTEWGESVIELTFKRDGRLEFKMSSVSNGQVTTTEGLFVWKDGKLTSSALNKGLPVEARLEKDALAITVPPDGPMDFYRIAGE